MSIVFRPVFGAVEVVRCVDFPTGWKLSGPWQDAGIWTFHLSVEVDGSRRRGTGRFFLEPGRIRFWLPWHSDKEYGLKCAQTGLHIEGTAEEYDEFLHNLAFTAQKNWIENVAAFSDPYLQIGPFRSGIAWRPCPRGSDLDSLKAAPMSSFKEKSGEGQADGGPSDPKAILTLMRALAEKPGKERAAHRLHLVMGGAMKKARELAADIIDLNPSWFDRNTAASAYRLSPEGYRFYLALEDRIGVSVPKKSPLFPGWTGRQL
jgi:hypothetical protein